MNRWWIVALVGLVVAGGGFGYSQLASGVPVEGAKVRRGAIAELIDETAKTRLPHVHLVTMPFTGRIEPIPLVEGTPVKKGQTVARIVRRDMDLTLRAATETVARLEAAIEENAFDKVERTGYQQTLSFVASMDATVKAAQERVRSGEAKLNYAKSHFERVLRLRTSNSATQDEEDRARLLLIESEVDLQQDKLILSAVRAMQAATALMPVTVLQYLERKTYTGKVLSKQRDEAQVALDQARRDWERSTMTSPANGVVLERLESNERYLPAGTVLVKIGDLDQLEVESEVLSQDVVKVRKGDAAEVYGPAIGPRPAKAVVDRVYPAGFTKVSSLGVEQQRVRVVLKFAEEELGRLRQQNLGTEFRVRVRIFTERKSETLVVPRSALFRGPAGQWQLFVVRDGRARLQQVTLGLANDERAEVVEGLAEDEVVVLAPEASLADGVRVSAHVPE